MEQALGEMEKYSGTKAVTSPLEAANARQQYDAAAKTRQGGAPRAAPKVGETRTINGRLGRWDGKGWVAI